MVALEHLVHFQMKSSPLTGKYLQCRSDFSRISHDLRDILLTLWGK